MGKLAFYREGKSTKHLTDIAGILKVYKNLDLLLLLEKAVRELGLRDDWELVCSQ